MPQSKEFVVVAPSPLVMPTPSLDSLIPDQWRVLALDVGGDPASYGSTFLRLLVEYQEKRRERLRAILTASIDRVRINQVRSQLVAIRLRLDYLNCILKITEQKPLPPMCRPGDWFAPGDEVVYCLNMGYQNNSNFTSTGWEFKAGTIAEKVPFIGSVRINVFNDGTKEPTSDIHWPGLLHKWEIDHLKQNPETCEKYLVMGDLSVRGHNADGFREALERY